MPEKIKNYFPFTTLKEDVTELIKSLNTYKQKNNFSNNEELEKFNQEFNKLNTYTQSRLKIKKERLYVFSLKNARIRGFQYFQFQNIIENDADLYVREIGMKYLRLQDSNLIGNEAHLLKKIKKYFEFESHYECKYGNCEDNLTKEDFFMNNDQLSIEIANIFIEDFIEELNKLRNFLYERDDLVLVLPWIEVDCLDKEQNKYNKQSQQFLGDNQSIGDDITTIIPGFSFEAFHFNHPNFDTTKGRQKAYVVSNSRLGNSSDLTPRILDVKDKIQMVYWYVKEQYKYEYKNNILLNIVFDSNKPLSIDDQFKEDVKACEHGWANLSDLIQEDDILNSTNDNLLNFYNKQYSEFMTEFYNTKYTGYMTELKRLRSLQKNVNEKVQELVIELWNRTINPKK